MPSNMFSYLRTHHRRTGSNPTTPDPPTASQRPAASAQSAEFFTFNRLPDSSSTRSDSPVSPYPPVLPPIPRVASRHEPPSAARLVPKGHEQPTEKGSGIVKENKTERWGILDASPHVTPVLMLGSVSENNQEGGRRPYTAAPTGYRSKGQTTVSIASVNASGDLQSVPYSAAVASTAPSLIPPPKPQPLPSPSISEKSHSPKPLQLSTNANQGRHGKKGLHLRNPMSLLLRRRSGQTLENLSDESLVSHKSQFVPAMNLPDDYDPRIRGKGVHDFSAPRPRRNFSQYNDTQPSSGGPSKDGWRTDSQEDRASSQSRRTADSSPPKLDRPHTPVFTEHFDDDIQPQESESAIRAEALANKDFLRRASLQPPDQPSKTLPPFARHSPLSSPPKSSTSPLESTEQQTESPPLATVPESPLTGTFEENAPQSAPPRARSQAASAADPTWQPAGLPAHMNSRSSRFSFQMASDSSAQERLLEERHKAKAAEKAKAATSGTSAQRPELDPYEEDEEDAYDYDDMDEGGYEEEINMVGADADDEDGFGATPVSVQPAIGIPSIDFQNAWKTSSSPMSRSNPPGFSDAMPQNTAGHTTTLTDEAESSPTERPSAHENQFVSSQYYPQGIQGLGLLGLNADAVVGAQRTNDTPSISPDRAVSSGRQDSGKAIHAKESSDDLYFDDGLIEVQDDVDGDGADFNESAFDDPNGPFYARPPPKPRPQARELLIEEGSTLNYAGNGEDKASNIDLGEGSETLYQRPRNTSRSLTSHQAPKSSEDPGTGFKDLIAYHSALADAANKAAANGRFLRKDSMGNGSIPSNLASKNDQGTLDSVDNSRPSLLPSDDIHSQDTPPASTGLGVSGLEEEGLRKLRLDDDYEYSDFDDNLEDDPMIAEANAEALANDSDGFYGQEFGFYAAPVQNLQDTEAQGAFGGYFGPKGFVELARRNTLREPNLTPITERSEFSTRNSFISLKQINSVGVNGALPSPGLAQLARMSPYGFPNGSATDDDASDLEMSLAQLQKLKKSAFGGSQVSLGSTSSSPMNNSPTVPRGCFSTRGQNLMMPAQQAVDGDKAYSSTSDSDRIGAKAEDGDREDETQDMDDYEAELDGADFDDNRDSFISDDSDEEDSPRRSASPTITAANQFEHALTDTDSDDAGIQAKPAQPHLSINTTQASAYALPDMSPISPFLAFPASATSSFLPSPSSTNPKPPPHQLPAFTFPPQAYTPPSQSQSPTLPPNGSSTTATATATTLERRAATTKGHSRQDSSADRDRDSVAYVREDDERGGKRWVLERRRTAETGELELVGRTVVEGGRI